MKGECVLPAPARSSDSPTNIDSITESIASLRLCANEAQASKGTQPHDFNYSRMECQLNAFLGPHPSQEDLHCLYFVFANAMV
jgi:hypothetical protein